jgi:hypothetical protein
MIRFLEARGAPVSQAVRSADQQWFVDTGYPSYHVFRLFTKQLAFKPIELLLQRLDSLIFLLDDCVQLLVLGLQCLNTPRVLCLVDGRWFHVADYT